MSAPGIVEFLRARLDEDELVACEAERAMSRAFADVADRMGGDVEVMYNDDVAPLLMVGVARFRAEVAAKRAIMEGFVAVMAASMFADRLGPSAFRGYDTVQALAAVYSGHPDYRESWAPRG